MLLTSYFASLCFVSTLTTDCGYRWFCYFYLPTSCITSWSTSLIMHMSLTVRFFYSFIIFLCLVVAFSFLLREALLTFLVKLDWQCWPLLTSVCLQNSWPLLHSWITALASAVFFVVEPFFTLNLSCLSLLDYRVAS